MKQTDRQRLSTIGAILDCDSDEGAVEEIRNLLREWRIPPGQKHFRAASYARDERRFSLQDGTKVSWADAEKAWGTYVRLFGKHQTLERLGQCGGFSRYEYRCLWLGHDPGKCCLSHDEEFKLND